MDRKSTETGMLSLNREQRKAVSADPEKPCLVIAGPGSGKTAVIAARCRFLIEETGCRPQDILVLTFTRAAAAEMQNRFRLLTGGKYGGVTFGTFHAVFFRSIAKRYGLTRENLVGEDEKRRLLQEILFRLFPEAAGDGNLAEALLTDFSLLRSAEGGPESRPTAEGEGIRAAAGNHLPQALPPEEAIRREYLAELRKRRKIDYDDILFLAREMLLEEEKDVRRFRFILADEFQDLSPVQYDILRLLAGTEGRIFAVGDDDQAIYRFRGASPDLMLRFPKDYPDCTLVRLGLNYRSAPEIVTAASRLISHNQNRFRKTLRAASNEQGSVLLKHFPTDREAYRALAEELRACLFSGEELSETAVLFRTNSAISACSDLLTSAGIPFITCDKVPNPFRHFAVQPVFACINFAMGDLSRGNFLRFMNVPPRYIRRSDLQSSTVSTEALKALYRRDEARKWMAERIEFFESQIALLGRLGLPYAMVNYIRKGMETDEYWKEETKNRSLDIARIFEALDFVQDSAREFRTVREWYSHIAAFTREIEDRRKDTDPKGRREPGRPDDAARRERPGI